MDSSDTNNQRNRGDRSGSVDDEVQKLLRKSNGQISSADFMRLRNKYDDVNLVEKIQKAYIEKHSHISKKAKKFAQLIREKYSNQQYPFHVLLEKARLYKAKYNLSEDEFTEFQRIYEQELVGIKSAEVLLPMTNVMKTLGSINVDFQGFNTKLNDNDYKYLQELLKLFSSSRPLHAQVLLQSMQYQDCGYEAVTGQFRRDLGHRPGDSVHAVIAALFLPKIPELESHFLHSNLSGIIKSRYNGEQLTNRPDYELFYSLVNDPNDVVCDNRSTLLDLLNRAQLQNQLWNCVLNLRNGQYYNASFRDFVGSVDLCRLNKNDNPDLIYGRYDGTILKRLLSAFSYRPTIVATSPVYNIVAINPYQQNVRPVVTAVPMINLRLPSSLNDNSPVHITDALEQQQYFLENGSLIPRSTSLIYSRGVLFFFVDRRSNVLRYQSNDPFELNRLPVALSGFERINDREINFEMEFPVRGDLYKLRSVVVAEINSLNTRSDYVVGSSTLVAIHRDVANNVMEDLFFQYDPLSAGTSYEENGAFVQRGPVTQITRQSDDGTSFMEKARKRGVIFMYQLVRNISNGEITY
jgi:hypothetical protein